MKKIIATYKVEFDFTDSYQECIADGLIDADTSMEQFVEDQLEEFDFNKRSMRNITIEVTEE